MGRAVADAVVERPPAEALEAWTDVERWRSFVDGFARAVEVSPDWPTAGSQVTWESTPQGRGRVSERVAAYEALPPAPNVAVQSTPGQLVTRVEDDSLAGTQSASFAPVAEGTQLRLELDYQLKRSGPLTGLTDAVFIRRAVRDSLRRTVERFAAEMAAEARSA